MYYLNKFANQADYDEFVEDNGGLEYHNVSIVGDNDPSYDEYYNMPLTFQIIGEEDWEEGDTYEIRLAFDGLDSSFQKNVLYRINDGEWEPGRFGQTTIDELNPGDTVQFQGLSYGAYGRSSFDCDFFECSTYFNLFGNLDSLIPSDGGFYSYHFAYLFYECEGLISAKNLILPRTALSEHCYENMFRGCIHLIEAPNLPATSLNNHCYNGMFRDCISLTEAPELPATSLNYSCYSSMFMGCRNLTVAPILLAATLPNYCYQGMFSGCTKLNYIKCLACDISAIQCTQNWLGNVNETGVFEKCDGVNWGSGQSGIPYGWVTKNIRVLTMWIDDYPDPYNTEYTEEKYGYSSFDDYLDDYMEDPESFQSNRFYYTNATVTYNNVTYYAWYCDELDIYYLTNTINYNTLYNLSTEANHSNRNCPVYAALWGDLDEEPYVKDYYDPEHILAKIENNGNGNLTMWIDDFPSVVHEMFGFETYDEYFDYLFANNPGGSYNGANKYVYVGETLQYDGAEYFLWRCVGDSSSDETANLLTSTIDLDTLYDMSIEDDYSNRNCPVYTFLTPDMNTSPYQPNYDDDNYILLKVE